MLNLCTSWPEQDGVAGGMAGALVLLDFSSLEQQQNSTQEFVSNPAVHESLTVNPHSVLEWINAQNFLWEQSHSCLVAQGWSGGHSSVIRVGSSDVFSVV